MRPRGEAEAQEWSEARSTAFLHQVFFNQHPPKELGLRNTRELLTLSYALDHLTGGRLGELGDLLMQRYKAVMTAVVDGSWGAAKHQELIPPSDVSLTRESERDYTMDREMRHLKMQEKLQKVRSTLSGGKHE